MTAIVFMDTETTGLDPDDEVWEFAAVRRETDGAEIRRRWFVRHNVAKAARLPASFRDDHRERYNPTLALTRANFAAELQMLFLEKPGDPPAHVVGAVPNFDTERLARILRDELGEPPPWHRHLVDVETLAVGALRTRARIAPLLGGERADLLRLIEMPWDSDAVSRALGVEPPGPGVRHTAMGDVLWTIDLYDAVMGAAR